MRLVIALAGLALVWGAMLWLGGTGADRTILRAIYDAGAPFREIARAVTHVGSYPALAGIALIALIGLVVRGEDRRALLLFLLATTGPLLVELQKSWFGRLRPHDQEHLTTVQSYAFPSGHSANSLLIWLSLALLCVAGPRARKVATALALFAAFLVALSRPMLGVHWPSDLVGGWALALFWLLLLSRLAGVPLNGFGTPAAPGHSLRRRRMTMDKQRPDDSALIDEAEPAPAHAGTSGGNLHREVSARAEEEHEIGQAGGEGDAVTRVHKSDKPRDGDRPNLPNRN